MRTAICLCAAVLLSGCPDFDLFNTQFDDDEGAVLYEAGHITAAPLSDDGALKVMTWNVKFAGGRIDFFFECRGDRALMTEDEVLSNLQGLADFINYADPDILLLQEVDVESKRTTYIDMLQWLLDHTKLNHGAYASLWKADFIPSDGLGRMNMGVATLSKWPMDEGTRIALPLVAEFDGIKQYFYLKRAMLRTRVLVPGHDDVYVVNIHTEAFSKDGTRKKQIDLFRAELDRLAALGKVVIGGGDLNTVPPATTVFKNFADSACTAEEFDADDFGNELDTLAPFYADDSGWSAAITPEAFEADQAAHFTHTTDADGFWNRKLDYLFTNQEARDGTTHQGVGEPATMPLSDHAPISFTVVLP